MDGEGGGAETRRGQRARVREPRESRWNDRAGGVRGGGGGGERERLRSGCRAGTMPGLATWGLSARLRSK